MSPLISIIIPVYNAEKYLKRCIDSCLGQTIDNLEILLVNDGSTDHSLDICRTYEKAHPCIHVMDKEDTGVSDTRNQGIAAAGGEYLMFVDSDDYLEHDMCARLLECMKPGVDLVVCGYVREGVDTREEKCPVSEKNFSRHQHLEAAKAMDASSILFVCWNKLYRKEKVVHPFCTEMTFGEDSVFNMQYIAGCDNICMIPYVGYHYDVSNQGSAMKRYHENMLQMCIHEYEQIYKGLGVNSEKLAVKQFAAHHFMDNMWYFVLPVLVNCETMTRKEKIIEVNRMIQWISKEKIQKVYTPSRKIHRIVCLLLRLKMTAVVFEILTKVLYRR